MPKTGIFLKNDYTYLKTFEKLCDSRTFEDSFKIFQNWDYKLMSLQVDKLFRFRYHSCTRCLHFSIINQCMKNVAASFLRFFHVHINPQSKICKLSFSFWTKALIIFNMQEKNDFRICGGFTEKSILEVKASDLLSRNRGDRYSENIK